MTGTSTTDVGGFHRKHNRVDSGTVAHLVRSAANGDQQAWDRLVDTFAPTVWAIVRSHQLSFTETADVFQTTWLSLLDHLHSLEHPERVGAWLATTARQECLRALRLADRQVPDATAAVESKSVINRVVDELPIRSQVLLRLLSVDSPLSYRDISEALSMPIGSIGPTRARALHRLRRLAPRAGFDLQDIFWM